MNLLNIRSWADFRAFLHTAVPGLAAFLVGVGVLTGGTAALWIALGLAVFDSGLSALNTADGFRKWFYPVMGAVSAVLIGYGIFTANDVAPWVALVPVLIGGGVASANTDTTPSV